MPGEKIDERLRKLLSRIENSDEELGKELKSKRRDANIRAEARSIAPADPDAPESTEQPTEDFTEAVIMRIGRPVLTIVQNDAQLVFSEPESEIWRQRLMNAKQALSSVIPSVGRVEIQNHPRLDWAGTGWLIAKNIIVTNRHVAEIFGRSSGNEFVFRQSPNGAEMGTAIDLLQEHGNPAKRLFKVHRILHIEPEPGPDIAFLEVDQAQGDTPTELVLNNGGITVDSNVAVIGYPAMDSRMPDVDLMEKIFGNVFNKKRLAPGQITNIRTDRLFHDCSTLGGCSGGAVVDLATGRVAGLHFGGRFMEANFAVPAALVMQCLDKIKGSRPSGNQPGNSGAGGGGTPGGNPAGGSPEASSLQTNLQTSSQQSNMQGNQCTFTIPLQITISIGQPSAYMQPAPADTTTTVAPAKSQDEIDNDELITEARAEDFADRKGYEEDFLGEDFKVPLPEAKTERRKQDLLMYDNNGQQDHVLRYEHFSVAMSKARRMCIYSACNINGRTAKGGIPRVPWRLDPRIPKEAQIKNECYGDPPRFSRGHMTRREDPVWGSESARIRGNADSMTVTNATPQMQSFNAPVWLALEDYALQNARDDKMRISVFTGPILKPGDPVRFEVKVPVEFWKIIAFIHDETGELSATGYKMSQKDHLPEEEFVFGEFETAQVPIRKIENLTGLSFGNLSDHDPLNDTNEGLDVPDKPLTSVREIKFR